MIVYNDANALRLGKMIYEHIDLTIPQTGLQWDELHPDAQNFYLNLGRLVLLEVQDIESEEKNEPIGRN